MFKVKEKNMFPVTPKKVFAAIQSENNQTWFLFYSDSEWSWDLASRYEPWIE